MARWVAPVAWSAVWPVVWIGVACLGGACSFPEEEYFGKIPDPDPTHFTYCNSGEPAYIDPGLASTTTDMKLIYAMFDGLTDHDPAGGPEPSAAGAPEVSPDGKTFTFHLRPDLSWSNGRRLVAADFVYSWARALHPLTGASKADTLGYIRHAKEFTAGTARIMLRDAGPFRRGEVVNATSDKAPSPEARTLRSSQPLRGAAGATASAHGKLPAGAEVTLIELGGAACASEPKDFAACDWAYVYHAPGDGVYGWVPVAELAEPNGDKELEVVALDDPPATARKASVKGRDLAALPEVVAVRASGEDTLVVELQGPTPFFLDLTLQAIFRPVPREVVERWPRKWTRPEHIVTSGAFHLTFWRQRDKFEMVKSKTFWDRDNVKLERVTFTSMNDQAANAHLYYQGGCDAVVANNIPNTYFPVLAGEVGQKKLWRKDYHRDAFNGIYYYLVNAKKYPNVHFRRALSHGLDRSKLPSILKGGQIPAESYTPGTPFASMSDEQLALCGATREQPGVGMIVGGKHCYTPPIGPRFDPVKAKEELAIARREMGAAFPAKLTVKFNSGVEYHKVIAEWIQSDWQKHLGLTVELESQEWKMFVAATLKLEYDVARFGGIGNFEDPEAEFLPQFKCKSPDNRNGWCNPEFDRLYEEAEKEPDRDKRLAIIRRAEDIMINEAPILPLYVYTQHNLRKPYVKGLSINLADHPNIRRVWIDPRWREAAP